MSYFTDINRSRTGYFSNINLIPSSTSQSNALSIELDGFPDYQSTSSIILSGGATPKEVIMKQFFYKSKNNDDISCGFSDWRKQLSPTYVSVPIEYIVDTVHKRYSSIEHCYQAQRFMATNPEYSKRFEIGGDFDVGESHEKGLLAKKSGSKTQVRKCKVVEDPEWTTKKVEIMRDIILIKLQSDTQLQIILEATKPYMLVHYERGKKAFWGATVKKGVLVGENNLGKLWMDIRDTNA